MENKLPDKVFGISTEGAYEKFLARAGKEPEKANEATSSGRALAPVNIQGDKYIQISGTNALITKEEIYKGNKWDETHYTLADNGLYMPTPKLFMRHFLNVRSAVQGNTNLYDGNNNPISREEIEDLWKYLTSGHRGGCWAWLDAKFIKGSGALGLDILTDHEVVANGPNKSLTPKTRKPLEQCVQEDCYADLDSVNSQGLFTSKAGSQNYERGKNIFFWHPRKDRVARFVAGSGWAILSCGWVPGNSDSWLGVLACAEGTKKT